VVSGAYAPPRPPTFAVLVYRPGGELGARQGVRSAFRGDRETSTAIRSAFTSLVAPMAQKRPTGICAFPARDGVLPRSAPSGTDLSLEQLVADYAGARVLVLSGDPVKPLRES
jgi:hypothetical protein